MAVNEEIVAGRKFRKLIDAANKKWQRISFWSKATDTEFNDGKNAETKVGAIDGITDSLVSTSSRIAASAKAVNTLSNNLVSNIYVGTDGKLHKVQGGADTVLPFNNVAEIAFDQETSNGYQMQGYSNDGGKTWIYNTIRGATTLNTKYGQLIRNSDTTKKYKFTSDRTAMFIASADSVFTPTLYKNGTIIPTYGYTAGGLLVIVF